MAVNRRRLTDRTIQALKAHPARTVDYPDELTPGLALRVTPQGAKSFSYRFRWQDKPTRVSLGRYRPEAGKGAGITLARARERAGEAHDLARRGIHPAQHWKRHKAEGGPLTLRQAVDRWAAGRRAKGRRSVDRMRRVLEIHALPELGDQPVTEIGRRDVVRLLEAMRDRGLRAQVNRVHVTLSGVFRWAVNAGEAEAHPLAGLEPLVAQPSREVVLSLDQIVEVWRAADAMSSEARGVVKLILLTACRREEAARLTWRELDLPARLWTLPAARAKGKREHAIPLSPQAVEVIGGQKVWAGGAYVFTASGGRRPFAGWRHAVKTLREAAALVDAEGRPLAWSLHDLRRAVATALGDHVRVSEDVVSMVLGHSKPRRIGTTAVYDRSLRLDDVRAALDKWGALLARRIRQGERAKVVALRTRAQ